LGIGDWGLGIGDWGLGPIPNPHPQRKFYKIYLVNIYYLQFKFLINKNNNNKIKRK